MADRSTAGPTCTFSVAWRGKCGEPCTESGLCSKHEAMTCRSCGQPATHECDYTGQFVCGAPLCGKCAPYVEQTPNRDSGMFFMSHEHRSIQWIAQRVTGESNV